jgi:hypothetical protein
MKNIVIVALMLMSFNVWSQVQDPDSPGFDFDMNADSSESDNSEEGEQQEVVAKPYERIVLTLDSITNLIEYTAIVEQEESSSDSLYIRTKNFAIARLSSDGKGKGIFEVDKKNQKLVIDAVIPAYSYQNKYTKKLIGSYKFKMTVWFKEGRYKYTITNLVHEGIKPNAGEAKRNYFEYYYTTTTNIKGVDAILRWADKDIQDLIEKYKKAMREPVFIDEEEW